MLVCARGMVGIEYQVDHEYNQGLFVVHKHYRRAPTTCTAVLPLIAALSVCPLLPLCVPFLGVLLASYYVAEGVIYPCPDLASVISSRLSTSIYFLQETLRALDVSTDERPSIHGDVKDRLEVQSSSHVTDTIKGRYEQWKRLENGEPEKFNFLLAAFASEDAAR